MGVPGGAGGQQRTTQPRRGHGEGVDALVQIPVGRGAADAVVAGQLRQPGAVEKPAQHQDRLPVAARRPAPAAGATAPSFGGQQARHELHGLLGDRKDGGVGDRIGHSRTSGGKTVCEKTSLLPRSCVVSGHLAVLGVSLLTCGSPATGKASLSRYVGAARKVTGGGRRSAPAAKPAYAGYDPAAVRAWAAGQGIKVSAR